MYLGPSLRPTTGIIFSLKIFFFWHFCSYTTIWLMMLSLTGNRNNLDVPVWHIDTRNDATGFFPHRDRQPSDVAASFAKRRNLSGRARVPLALVLDMLACAARRHTRK